MAYPKPIIRIIMGGKLPGPEEWACTVSYADLTGGSTIGDLQGAFETFSISDVGDDVAAWITAPDCQFMTTTTLTYVKAALILTDGSYSTATAENPRVWEPASATHGTAGGGVDNQRSWAVTLYSGTALGKGNYGRFFAPPQGISVQSSTGAASASEIDPFLAKTVTMLEAIKGEVDTVLTDIHQVIPTEVGAAHKRIQEVRIGHVADTQRRRRRSIPENYSIDDSVSL